MFRIRSRAGPTCSAATTRILPRREVLTDDGWLKTGDVGRWTEVGFLQIVDRKKDILVTSGGKNLAPANIEVRFADDPLIAHVVVAGDGEKYLVAGVWLNEAAVDANLKEMQGDRDAARRALETRGSDNVAFPGAAYREYVRELYQRNLLAKGEFHLSGRRVRMEELRVPVLAIAFQHDTIVPQASAAELVQRVASEDKELWVLPGGHVGAVVSRAASKGLWPKMSAWWAVRD